MLVLLCMLCFFCDDCWMIKNKRSTWISLRWFVNRTGFNLESLWTWRVVYVWGNPPPNFKHHDVASICHAPYHTRPSDCCWLRLCLWCLYWCRSYRYWSGCGWWRPRWKNAGIVLFSLQYQKNETQVNTYQIENHMKFSTEYSGIQNKEKISMFHLIVCSNNSYFSKYSCMHVNIIYNNNNNFKSVGKFITQDSERYSEYNYCKFGYYDICSPTKLFCLF